MAGGPGAGGRQGDPARGHWVVTGHAALRAWGSWNSFPSGDSQRGGPILPLGGAPLAFLLTPKEAGQKTKLQ